MNPLNIIIDPYDRQARLYPALLLISPAVVTVVALFFEKLKGVQSLGSLVVGFGGAFLLTELARDAGKKGEKLLFKKWDGMPSVSIFRHSDLRLDSITKARYHQQLSILVKGAEAPTAASEQANPIATNEIYIAWSHYLRVNTRDKKKFPLLFHENVSYGYRRNVWGLRPIGIIFCALCVIFTIVYLWFEFKKTGQLSENIAGSFALSFIFLLLWLFRFTPEWVRVPAEAYAERLAEAIDVLVDVPASKSSTPKKKGANSKDASV